MNIQESLHCILENRDALAQLFYPLLFERHPQMRDFFRGVDMQRQALMLTMALMVCERHHHFTFPATEAYLQYLGSRHAARHIPMDLYPLWRDVMLEALQRFHSTDWNADLEEQWRGAIDKAVVAMAKGYLEKTNV